MATARASLNDIKAEEYRRRAEADVNPAESDRDRLARLKREAAEVEKRLKLEDQQSLNETLRPQIDAIIKSIEESTGKVCRNLTVRYQQPGDGDVPVVVKLENGTPGLVIAFRVVKPRQKDS